MGITELHKITGDLIDKGHGPEQVTVNIDTFWEGDNGENISPVDKAEIVSVGFRNPDDESEQGTENYFVLSGDA